MPKQNLEVRRLRAQMRVHALQGRIWIREIFIGEYNLAKAAGRVALYFGWASDYREMAKRTERI